MVQDENHSDHSLHVLGNEEDTTEEAPNTENHQTQEVEQEMQQKTNKTQTSSREQRRLNGKTAMPKVNGCSLTLMLMQF